MGALRVLWKILSPRQRGRYVWLVAFSLFNAVTELIAIATVAYFMHTLRSGGGAPNNPLLARYPLTVEQWGYLSVALFTTSNVTLGLGSWARASYAWAVEVELSARLLEAVLRSSDAFGDQHSATFVNEISGGNVTQRGLMTSLTIWSRFFTTVLLTGALLVNNWKVTLAATVLLVFVFSTLAALLQGTVRRMGRGWWKATGLRQRLLQEILAMRKLLYIRQHWDGLLDSYRAVCRDAVRAAGQGTLLASLPRYMLESTTMCGIVLLCLHMLHRHDPQILESITLFGLASYRILPGLHELFSAHSELNLIRPQAEATLRMLQAKGLLPAAGRLPFATGFRLESISVTHAGRQEPALQSVSLEVPVGMCLGIAGGSGAGKSTLLDVCMGLIKPQQGTFTVDGQSLTEQQWLEWRRNLGYLPQQVEVLDDSISANITLGLKPDAARIETVIAHCHLSSVIASLPQGLETRVGEGGAFLSVGQRQRMGLARALYEDPPVLILDEMSSSLDAETEEYILREIQSLAGSKTVVMAAHRAAVLKVCDRIVLLEKGHVIGFGDFQHLWETVPQFKILLSQDAEP